MSVNLYLADAFGWDVESTAKVAISRLREEKIISRDKCPKAQLIKNGSLRWQPNLLKFFGYIPVVNVLAGIAIIAQADSVDKEFFRPDHRQFWIARGVAMIFTGPLLFLVDLVKVIYDYTVFLKFKEENKGLIEAFNTSHKHTPAYWPGHPIFCCTKDGKDPRGHQSGSSFFYSQTFIDGIEIFHFEDAYKITLQDFQKMDTKVQKATIEKFQLQESIDAIGEEVFFQKLAQANPKALALVSLVNLRTSLVNQSVKFALMSDDEFRTVTLNQLTDASDFQIKHISARVKDFKEDGDVEGPILEIPVIKFQRLSARYLSECIHQIPACAISLLSDSQIQGVDFANASKEQLFKLFQYVDGVEEKRRFALLSAEQVQSILNKLDEYQLRLVSDEQKRALNL